MQYPQRYCPYFHHTAELIGRRWTAVILRVLAAGPGRFGDIRDKVPGLSDRLLTNRLGELESEGLVVRCEADGNKCYALSDKGGEVIPVLEALQTLAASWARPGDTPATRPGRIRTDT